MRWFRGFLTVLCALILGAHFLRYGAIFPMAIALVLVPLACVPRPWARVTVGAVLVLGALEWVHTLLVLRADRVASGAPHLRMTFILGAVALVTLVTGLWKLKSGRAQATA